MFALKSAATDHLLGAVPPTPGAADADDPFWSTSVTPLCMRWWDGDCVVYNPLTGSTHVLDIVTGEVLTAIMTEGARTSALRQRVARFLELPEGTPVDSQLDQILKTLDDLGLIEPRGGC